MVFALSMDFMVLLRQRGLLERLAYPSHETCCGKVANV
jgi:hypothetical protein